MSIDAVFAQFFDNIHDPRQHAKIYYPFYDVLFLTVCAVIGGAEGWEDIEDFGEVHLPWFQSKGLFKNGIPVHDTIARDHLRHQTRAVSGRLCAVDSSH